MRLRAQNLASTIRLEYETSLLERQADRISVQLLANSGEIFGIDPLTGLPLAEVVKELELEAILQ